MENKKSITWIVLGLIALAMVGGIELVAWLQGEPLGFPDPNQWTNAFFVTTTRTEPTGLYVVLGFCVFVALLWLGKSPRLQNLPLRFVGDTRKLITLLAFFTFAVSLAGTWLVTHRYALAADENMPDFQAKIFLSGKLQTTIPEELRFAGLSFKPLQAVISADDTRWNQSYLPVYAALRTPFVALHLQNLVNPLLSAMTVFCLAGVIRILWPGHPWLAVAGASFVAFSPQILINGMTSYAMPAHLAFNTLWLWLYLQPEKRRFWLAPLVGIMAIGLHSPFVHALFVIPFLLRMLWEKRWKAGVIFGIIYFTGCTIWWQWWHHFAPGNASAAGGPLLTWNLQRILLTQPFNLLNLISWNALPLALPTLLGLRYFRHLPIPVRDGVMGCGLTFCFYALIAFDQGLGWGNRYFYGVLGCLMLLGVGGLHEWTKRSGPVPSVWLMVTGLALTALVALPLRCWQVERFIRPYAKAQEAFQKMNVDLIIYDPRQAWYSSDLRRNDPFLQHRPLVANILTLTTDEAKKLRELFPKRRFVTGEELTSYGLSTQHWATPIEP